MSLRSGGTEGILEWASGHPDPAEATPGVIIELRERGLSRVVPESNTPGMIAMERTNSPVEIPPIILNELTPRQIPVGATHSLQFDVLRGPPPTYQWHRDSLPLTGQTNVTLDLRPENVLNSLRKSLDCLYRWRTVINIQRLDASKSPSSTEPKHQILTSNGRIFKLFEE